MKAGKEAGGASDIGHLAQAYNFNGTLIDPKDFKTIEWVSNLFYELDTWKMDWRHTKEF